MYESEGNSWPCFSRLITGFCQYKISQFKDAPANRQYECLTNYQVQDLVQ